MSKNIQSLLYKDNGVRSRSELTSPNAIRMDTLVFPPNAIVHWLNESTGAGPDGLTLHFLDSNPYMVFVDDFGKNPNNGVLKSGAPFIMKAYKETDGVRRMTRPIHSVLREQVVYSYGVMSQMVRYSGSTIFKTIAGYDDRIQACVRTTNEIARLTDKPQYWIIDAPDTEYSHTELSVIRRTTRLLPVASLSDYFMIQLDRYLHQSSSSLSSWVADDNIFLVVRYHEHAVIYAVSALVSLATEGNIAANSLYKIAGINNITDVMKQQIVPGLLSSLHSHALTNLEDVPEAPETLPDTVLIDSRPLDLPTDVSEADKTDEYIESLKRDPRIDKKMITRYKKAVEKSKTLVINGSKSEQGGPADSVGISDELATIVPEEMVPPMASITDDSMRDSKLKNFDRHYIDNVMDKHITAVLTSFGSSGLAVTAIDKVRKSDITGAYDEYRVTAVMVDGKQSTLSMRLPVVSSEGIFKVDDVDYRLRRQSVDLPIRKIDTHRVELSSYRNVLFVDGSSLAVDDYVAYLNRHITNRDPEREPIAAIRTDVYQRLPGIPDMYSRLSKLFDTLTIGNTQLSFNYRTRKDYGDVKALETKGRIVVGKRGKHPITIDAANHFELHMPGGPESLGTIYSILDIDPSKAPRDIATVRVGGKRTYVGMMLAYLMGLTSLFRWLRVKTEVHKPRARIETDGIVLKFSDCQVEITGMSRTASRVLSGILKYSKVLRAIPYAAMDQKDVYPTLTEGSLTIRHYREYELLETGFIDPITKEVLTRMKEPTTFKPLILRAVELLDNAYHPEQSDGAYSRHRGYERFAGAIYHEMSMALRTAKAQINPNKRKLEMSPFAVWGAILQDNAIKIIEETNPLMWLKDQESLTITGAGGRSRDALTMDSRKYHPNHVGTISEYVPDNGDVGLNTFLTIDPAIDNIYGMVTPTKDLWKQPSKNYSTSHAFTPGAKYDDPKRMAFISIMNSHTIAMEKMTLPYVRTGYEYIIPHRVGKVFAYMAEKPGRVKSVNETGIIITHTDGTEIGVRLGTQYTKAEGTYYPNNNVTRFKVGDKVAKGDAVAWNDRFFEFDYFENRLAYKQTVTALVCLYEGEQTFEDSCAISTTFSGRMSSRTAKFKSVTVDFNDTIHQVVKPGDKVDTTTPLLVIEDSSTAGMGLFDDANSDSLSLLVSNSPKAAAAGVIDRVEVYYNGNIEDMSEELQALAKASDKRFKLTAKSIGETQHSGKVSSNHRVEGKNLLPNQCAIRFYLIVQDDVAIVDKLVLMNQLKATVGDIVEPPVTVESKEPVDFMMSRIAIDARIVGSFDIVSMLSTSAWLLTKEVAAAWKS